MARCPPGGGQFNNRKLRDHAVGSGLQGKLPAVGYGADPRPGKIANLLGKLVSLLFTDFQQKPSWCFGGRHRHQAGQVVCCGCWSASGKRHGGEINRCSQATANGHFSDGNS